MKYEHDIPPWAIFAVIFMVAMVLMSCASKPADRPPCGWKLWSGQPDQNGIVRTQDKVIVRCSDPQFQGFICLTPDDLRNLLSCGVGK